MMEMSKIAGCNPAEYSAYEHERKAFDEEAYRESVKHLLESVKQRRAKELSVTERLLNLGPFAGEQKNWKGLEQWVDTVNEIIYDLKKNKK